MFVEWLIPTVLFWGLVGICIVVGLRLVPPDAQGGIRTAPPDAVERIVPQGHPTMDRAWRESYQRGERVLPAPTYWDFSHLAQPLQ